ncbi:MAG: hypothetical protein JST89_04515 [Cyanobacteria bacterium SZAS-4]|nr:hypothetical protein [Cyanobacteria bacterium SZAS-4]
MKPPELRMFVRNKINATALLLVVFSLSCGIPASALDDPDEGFHSLSDRYIQTARALRQEGLPMLAYNLEFRANADLGHPANDERTAWMRTSVESTRKNIEEFLTVYPQLSAENQRQLANQTLELSCKLMTGRSLGTLKKHYYGRHEEYFPPPPALQDPDLGNRLITCVLDSAEKNQYPSSVQMVSDFKTASEIPQLNSANKARILKVGDLLVPSKLPSVEPLLTDIESRVPKEWPLSKEHYQRPIPWKKFQLSWYKYLPKQTSKTPPAERRGAMPTYINIYVLPTEDTAQIRKDLVALLPIYLALPESEQHDICGRIGSIMHRLLHTNLNVEADNFYWKFLPTVKVGWLNLTISDSAEIFSSWDYYYNCYDLEKAKAIMTKNIAFENVTSFRDQQKYKILGDIYNMLHQKTEAKEQYLIAQKINEESFAQNPGELIYYKTNDDEIELRLKHLH